MVLGRGSLLDRVEVAHRTGDEAREPAARLGPLERIDVVLEANLSSIHPSAPVFGARYRANFSGPAIERTELGTN